MAYLSQYASAKKVHLVGLTVTLTFDLLTSKRNQFIFVPNYNEIVNLVKFPQMVCM